MRFWLTLLVTLFAASPPPPAPSGVAGTLTADQVARRIQERDTGRDSRADLRMKLFDRRDRVRELEDFTYALLDENAAWTSADGASHPAYRLESKRKDRSAEFPRVVSLVLKDSFVVVHADVYNRRDEKQKVYAVKRLEQAQGIWTVMESAMSNDLDKTRTELVVEKLDYNTGLKEDGFSRRALEAAGK